MSSPADTPAPSASAVPASCRVLGLTVESLPYTQPAARAEAVRAPGIALWACPECSFLPIHANGEVAQRGRFLRAPRFVTGARSRQLFLVADCPCAPVVGGFDTAEAAAAAQRWNAWAESRAHAKADRMRLDGETRASWLARLADPHRISLHV